MGLRTPSGSQGTFESTEHTSSSGTQSCVGSEQWSRGRGKLRTASWDREAPGVVPQSDIATAVSWGSVPP